jgi:monoamine oxidase
MSDVESFDAIVVGAGAAGLSAARALSARGARVVVLEAGPKVGGRVLCDTSLAEWPLELGPEFIHGEKNNRLLELIEGGIVGKPGASLVELEWPNYYFFGKEGELCLASEADEREDVALMHESFEKLGEMEPSAAEGTEQSLLQFFTASGLSSRVLDLADAIFANDYAADMSDVGLHEVMHEQRHWNYGEKYLVLKGACLQDAMNTLSRGLDVRTSWPVDQVRVVSQPSGRRVDVLGRGGRTLHAKAVVVTVPLPVLQRGEIRFEPALPTEHTTAVGALRVGNALKVIVRLGRRFWPSDFYDAVCSDSFMPEVWLSPAAELMRADARPPFTMVGFVAGARAERVARLTDDEVARRMLNQLDAMFGNSADPHPASGCCEGYIVKNWKTQPFTYGAYSHPTKGANGQRASLAKAVHGGAIFFAGEATHQGVNPCIHGAMETGEEAAERCWVALQRQRPPRSRL